MNKGRIIFWGIIAFILLSFGCMGFIFYNAGFGNRGQVRKDLMPIVNTFNNLKDIQNNKIYGTADIKAKLKDNAIVVSYNTQSSSSKFVFDYSENNVKMLILDYNNADQTNAIKIIKYMMDTISILNGHSEAELFSKYEYSDFENANIEQGIKIMDNGDSITVYLNINATPLDSKIIKPTENTSQIDTWYTDTMEDKYVLTVILPTYNNEYYELINNYENENITKHIFILESIEDDSDKLLHTFEYTSYVPTEPFTVIIKNGKVIKESNKLMTKEEFDSFMSLDTENIEENTVEN